MATVRETLSNRLENVCVYVCMLNRQRENSVRRRKTGFRIIKLQIAMVSSSPSNPAGFIPSGVLMHHNISQHAVRIPGNDN